MNAWDDIICQAYSGSMTYGTNITKARSKELGIPESDKDRSGVCIPPRDYTLGLQRFDAKNFKAEIGEDYTVYALHNYMHLASSCNPNILELLYLEDRFYIQRTAVFVELMKHRDSFLSKKAKHTYSGYAYSQFHKMKVKREHGTGRQELVEKYGFDTKFASHCIRLVRMGLEILNEGTLHVYRPDHQELLDIRLGKFSWEDFEKLYEYETQRLDTAYTTSTLRNSPDLAFLSKLCVDLHEEHYYGTRNVEQDKLSRARQMAIEVASLLG